MTNSKIKQQRLQTYMHSSYERLSAHIMIHMYMCLHTHTYTWIQLTQGNWSLPSSQLWGTLIFWSFHWNISEFSDSINPLPSGEANDTIKRWLFCWKPGKGDILKLCRAQKELSPRYYSLMISWMTV